MAVTAVEWLRVVLMYNQWQNLNLEEAINQALIMEREQIEDAFLDGMQCYPFDPNSGRAELYFESKYKNPEE